MDKDTKIRFLWAFDQQLGNFDTLDYLSELIKISCSQDKIAARNSFMNSIRQHLPNTLYKYYSLSSDSQSNKKKFKTLLQKKVYLSRIEDFNDPFEGNSFYYHPDALTDCKLKDYACSKEHFLSEYIASLQTVSFTSAGYTSLPMWAHYSNDHHGYCVSYDVKCFSNELLQNFCMPVQYVDHRIDITPFITLDSLAEQLEQLYKVSHLSSPKSNNFSLVNSALVLFSNIKNSLWAYEKEYRCNLTDFISPDPFLSANPKEIYIGLKCKETDKEKLLSIGKHLRIPVYQMYLDKSCPSFTLQTKLCSTT